MSLCYATRDEAIEREIVTPIEASGVVVDAHLEYDVPAITANALDTYPQGYVVALDTTAFWALVERHEL